ncbi:MAG: 3'-5' exonuclease domain-containing protein 2 [Bacteroidales bacterium]|nr:3'-5' exonuclease domain-containing protein 2 [Bacteroidales bacterium]MBN2818739.1 3'-5' exonuclease domain-containing protein 2 [Bacteroidales bacterium]
MRSDLSFKPFITKEEISSLPVNSFSGDLHFIDSFEKFLAVIHELKNESAFGFDTETRPAFKKGKQYDVSLLQLSVREKAYLFRLNKIGLPNELAEILASKDIKKIGVAIHDDILSLRKLNNFEPEGFIDLQQYVKSFGIEDNGLKKLAANILGFKISKRQQTSNWEADVLTPAQIEYAATDAWVCYEIFKKLEN